MQGIISIDNNQSTYIRKQALAGHNYEPFIQYFFNLLLLNIIFIQITAMLLETFKVDNSVRHYHYHHKQQEQHKEEAITMTMVVLS